LITVIGIENAGKVAAASRDCTVPFLERAGSTLFGDGGMKEMQMEIDKHCDIAKFGLTKTSRLYV
jgi:hypothetical protein